MVQVLVLGAIAACSITMFPGRYGTREAFDGQRLNRALFACVRCDHSPSGYHTGRLQSRCRRFYNVWGPDGDDEAATAVLISSHDHGQLVIGGPSFVSAPSSLFLSFHMLFEGRRPRSTSLRNLVTCLLRLHHTKKLTFPPHDRHTDSSRSEADSPPPLF